LKKIFIVQPVVFCVMSAEFFSFLTVYKYSERKNIFFVHYILFMFFYYLAREFLDIRQYDDEILIRSTHRI